MFMMLRPISDRGAVVFGSTPEEVIKGAEPLPLYIFFLDMRYEQV